jgi:hypothetical protein
MYPTIVLGGGGMEQRRLYTNAVGRSALSYREREDVLALLMHSITGGGLYRRW